MSAAADHGARRRRMVEEQLVRRGVRDEAVLAAMRAVPRHLFVPEELQAEAYGDTPLPIGLGQTISQPYMVGLMTALLGVDLRSRVLDVGAGSGYQTAVLAEVAGEVFALEVLAPLAERARQVLGRLEYANVRLAIGDGTRGWPEQAPFDGILVAAAAEEAPPELLRQLSDGGRLVAPLGRSHNEQRLVVFERHGDDFERRGETAVRFVPLIADPDPQIRAATGWRGRGVSPERRGGEGPAGPRLSGEVAWEGEMKTVSVKVSGGVQGVYYRASARHEGLALGLRGWVRNESDGGVALHLQGPPGAVDAMLAWCRVGPPAAQVSRLEVEDATPDETLTTFEVR